MNNNREQNLTNQGQTNYPNQGYPQQNNQYQGNVYNAQNQQYFNGNMNNHQGYQNQQFNTQHGQNSQLNNQNKQQYHVYNSQYQANNGQNSQFRGQSYNGQNPQLNNNTPYYSGNTYNGQNPQFRGQPYNGQNTQFNNMNNQQQFNNHGGYIHPNQFNPQFNNRNPNFNSMNNAPRINSKTIGYITAAVAALVIVLIVFMFSSVSGKLGGATPEEAVRNVLAGAKDGNYKKIVNNTYFENDNQRSIALEKINRNEGGSKSTIELSKPFMDMVEIGETKLVNENRAKVQIKAKGNELLKQFGGDTTKSIYLKKDNNRWFVEDNSL